MGIMPFAMLLNQTVRQCRACGAEFSTPSGNAKRCARCREQRKLERYSAGRIPVMSGPRCLEWAGPERVRQLLAAPNCEAIRRGGKQGPLVEIQVLEFGDDGRLHARGGNPQQLSHNCETDTNPRRVWELKRLPGQPPPEAA
jgi:hypothetical protein